MTSEHQWAIRVIRTFDWTLDLRELTLALIILFTAVWDCHRKLEEPDLVFNLVSINRKENRDEYPGHCHIARCPNPGRYQLYGTIGADELPDWEGRPICSRHLVDEARLRPEIVMSLLDILIDKLGNL
jgi:hypothetical protein